MVQHPNILLDTEKLGRSRLVLGKTYHLFPTCSTCSLHFVSADALAAFPGNARCQHRRVPRCSDWEHTEPRHGRWDNNKGPGKARSSPKCVGCVRAAGGAAAPRDSRSRCPAPPPRPGSAGICHRAAAWVGCVTAATERSKGAFKIEKEVLGSEWKIEVL